MKSISRAAIVLIAAFAVATPGIAAENWPDSFSEFVASVPQNHQDG